MENKREHMTCNSFVFYRSFFEATRELPPEQQAEVYDAVFRYGFDGEMIELKGAVKALFTLIKPQIEANRAKYENGCKGGRPHKSETEISETVNPTITEVKPKHNPTITEVKPKHNLSITKPEPNVNDNDNVYVNAIAANAANKAKLVLRNKARASAQGKTVLVLNKKKTWMLENLNIEEDIIEYIFTAECATMGSTAFSDRLAGLLKEMLEKAVSPLKEAIYAIDSKLFNNILSRMAKENIVDLESYVERIVLDEYALLKLGGTR